jgi:glucosamine 6-phosphate synthetase-like amidotransferase/phosphosugar isomerase protein
LAALLLPDAPRRLEYRRYDRAGMARLVDDHIIEAELMGSSVALAAQARVKRHDIRMTVETAEWSSAVG